MKFPLLSLLLLFPALAFAVPVNVALNQPVVADSLFSLAYMAENAVDGNSTSDVSRWLSDNTSYPHWIEVDLEQTYVLSQMKFWTGKNGTGPFPVFDFALQYWNGTGWTDLYSEANSTNAGAVDVSFGPTVSGNRVRLNMTNGQDDIVRLFELEIYGESHGLTYGTLFPENSGTLFDPVLDLVVSFDAPVVDGTLAGIRIENLDTGTDVSGVAASTSGNDLVISHSGLNSSGQYAVHVPEGVVLLGSDGTTPNGALYWQFETAPLKPQLAFHTNEIPNLTDPIEFTFDRDIGLLDDTGITVERFSDGATVGGLVVSVTGDTLSVTHDALISEEAYVVNIPAGAIEGLVNGEVNSEFRLIVFGGTTVLFQTDFDTGLEGFNTASLLGLASPSPASVPWRWVNSGTGPDYDPQYLRSLTNSTEDFVVSPLVDLVAGSQYVLEFRTDLNRNLYVGLTATASLDDVEEIAVISSGGPKGVRLEITATETGPRYFIFSNGDTNPWQDQLLDDFLFTESIPPLVRIKTPADGISFLESDNIPVEIEAFGLAGDLVSVEVFDNDVSRGSLSKTGDAYLYDWNYHAPGQHTFRVEVTDTRGNVSTDEVTVTVTFDDGTLPNYIGYDFDDGTQGWTLDGDGSPVKLTGDNTGRPGSMIDINIAGSSAVNFSSPQVFLLAGETYTFQCRTKRRTNSGSQTFAFLPTTVPGYPSDTSGAQTFVSPAGPDWTEVNLTFTVPADGAYHLTVFEPSISGYIKNHFDDIRLIGNFNSIPFVELTLPSSNVRTFAGADILFEVDASDSDGTIQEVSFRLADGSLLAPDAFDSSEPFSYLWQDVAEGDYSVIARALDDGLATNDSSSISIEVEENNLSISTYLGGPDTDESFTGAIYLNDGTLVLSGIVDPDLFPGVTPVYLNGATSGDRGVVARFTEDGTTVLSVSVLGSKVVDLDTDDGTRIYAAVMGDGAVVLNSAADTVLWSQSYASVNAHRIDAASGGTFAVLTSSESNYLENKVSTGTNYVYDTNYTQLGSTGGASAYTTDLAVDEASQTLVCIGWKNVVGMQDNSSIGSNPVDIPAMLGYAYDGTVKWRGYDWGKQEQGDRWLNRLDNNMADTRGSRVIVHEGKVYGGIEFDGGNTPLRYDPFDLAVSVPVVGGDQYHFMANTSTVPKVFIGVYDAGTGAYETGQWITNRLSNGNDNTIRMENGNILVDEAGRIHVVGRSAAGLPMTHDPFPSRYTGGGYHLVYSPDFESREFMTRLAIKGDNMAIALSPNGKIAVAGQTEDELFLKNEFQSTMTNIFDAYFAVGEYESYYNFQAGAHPRLFLDSSELQVIRDRLGEEPYASMYAALIANRDFSEFYKPHNPSNSRDLFGRAQGSAYLYALSGDETYAQDARDDIETALGIIGENWASPGVKGLELYGYAVDLAVAYDFCANSAAWDAGFKFQMSKRLRELAEVIITNGGTEQPSDLGSNWRAGRGGSAGLAFFATDHVFDSTLADSANGMVQNFLNNNQAPGAVGWNPEGQGYTAFALGNFVGPYGVAHDHANNATAYRDNSRIQGMLWTGFAGATTAYNVYGLGGVKTDWADDNAHTGGEGIYGLAFYYGGDELKSGLKHAYDRFMGAQSPHGAQWDGIRHGPFWSILFYPQEGASQDPTEIWDWHRRSKEDGGIGIFTFRNAYEGEDDILTQFKARLGASSEAHDGPDGLGFRLIGLDDAFVVGGGRNHDINELNQATVYPSDPNLNVTRNQNTGILSGTPLIKPDGGGHVIAQMGLNNVGTSNHKRWFLADFDSASTGAELALVIADTSNDGLFWQLPTFLDNTISTSGNTFTITGTQGATLKGTILHPGGTPTIAVGTKARGDGYTLENGGTLATEDPVLNPRIEENRYLYIQGSGDGDFLVVLTLVESGAHPTVTHLSGGVANAVVRIGTKNYALQDDDIYYSTGMDTPVTYSPPNATVTFDGDGKGTLSGMPVQSVPYGGAAIAPSVSPNSGYTFMGWDKGFDQVVKFMTVTAVYDAVASGFSNWISDGLYSLDVSEQGALDNPDFDLYVNLLEYVLVLDPSQPDGADVITIREESGNLILGYRVRDGATDVTVTPKYSDSMETGSWNPVPAENISPVGAGTNYTEYEASMPMTNGRLFMLLEVSQ